MTPETLIPLLSSHRDHSGTLPISHIETHISDVYLVGDTAYKFKKPIRLPFLDFSSLAQRKVMCEREVALNQRFAPRLYIGIVAIGFKDGKLNLEGQGEIVEYGVKMHRFGEADLWSHRAASGLLDEHDITTLIKNIATFHRAAERRPRWGDYPTIHRQILSNLRAIPTQHRGRNLGAITRRVKHELFRHRELIKSRSATHVCAIHGDLHLGNIATFNAEPMPFDGIEFSEELGSGDVWSDIGFLVMDLYTSGHCALATHAVNRYLEESDDFAGVPLLPLYGAHRALVRAKVHILSGTDSEDLTIVDRYLDTANDLLVPRPLRIIAVGGLSGSGKTTLARALAEKLGGIVIRTDVVRKHVLGLRPLDIAPESTYTPATAERIYRGLHDRARNAAPKGGVIVLDGVHRLPSERTASEALARELKASFTGLWCSVPKEVALFRVEHRTNDASNASREVIESQYREPPTNVGWAVLETSGDVSALITQALHIERPPGVISSGSSLMAG